MIIQRGHEYGVFHFYSKETGLLSKQVADQCLVSIEHAIFLIHFGSVYVNGQRLKEDIQIAGSSYIRAHTTPRRFLQMTSQQISERIQFESEDFIIINKPSGLPVHDTVDNCSENLIRCLEFHLKTPLYITHRLDVPTEGLILFAKTTAFQKYFNQLLAQKSVRKIYSAEVENSRQFLLPSQLTHFMKKSLWAPKQIVESQEPETQECQLQILNQKNFSEQNTSRLEIELLTGRTHQIRAQLSFIGLPIVNDILYGACKKETTNLKKALQETDAIHLTAVQLEFKSLNKLYQFKTKTSW